MAMIKGKFLFLATRIRGIRFVRFAHTDLNRHLDGNIDDCPLYQELRERVLDGLVQGETLVLNFGLVERFPAAFYACLLKVRSVVLGAKAHLVLCRLSPEQLEILKLFQADRLFHIQSTEGQALRDADAYAGMAER
jgi:anti-anti-sigma regulatory factor